MVIASMKACGTRRDKNICGCAYLWTKGGWTNGGRTNGRFLENLFLAAEITEITDIGDDKGYAELVFRVDAGDVQMAILDTEAAAAAVVSDLYDLAKQLVGVEIVADAGGQVEAFAIFRAVAREQTDLIGNGLKDGVRVDTEVRDSREKVTVGLYL